MSIITQASIRANTPQDIVANEPVFKVCFHPTRDMLVYGTLGGKLCLCQYYQGRPNSKLMEFELHSQSCRDIDFSSSGSVLYSCSSDRSVFGIDVETKQPVFEQKKAHKYSVSALKMHGDTLVTGDDNGFIKVWDVRKPGKARQIAANEDYISGFVIHTDRDEVVATSGDQTFSVIDLRKGVLAGRSDYFDEDLLCAQMIMNGKMLVCGGQGGDLVTCPWGDWKNVTVHSVHRDGLDCMVTLNANTVIIGTEQGNYRIVRVCPASILYVDRASDYIMGITSMSLCHERRLLVLCTDVTVRFLNVSQLTGESADEVSISSSDD